MEILNTYTVTGDTAATLWPLLFVGGLALIVFLVMTFHCFADSEIGAALFCLGITLIIAGLFTWGAIAAANDPDVTRYEVIFKEDTSLLEITSKYDIVKQEGLIYTLEEKTGD